MKAYFAGGRYNGMTVEVADIYVNGMWNGLTSEDHSALRANGVIGVPRKELDNQPKVDGYLGPMWDGDGLRYETQEVYDMLSR